MAKKFYYDLGTVDATSSNGTTGGTTTYNPTESAITNPTLANDQSIGAACTAFGDNDALRFNFGASVTARYVAVYFNATETDNIEIHCGSSATAMGAAKTTYTTTIVANVWTVIDIGSSQSGQYWFIVADGALVGLCEVMICNAYTFAANYDLGDSESKIHGIDIDRSYGNVKASNKRHDELKTWSWTWPVVSSADKTNLETFENSIDIVRLKFIFDDETTKWWVSKNNIFNFSSIATGYYSVSCELQEEVE